MASVSGANHSHNNFPPPNVPKKTPKTEELKTDVVRDKSLEGPKADQHSKLDNSIKIQKPADDLEQRLLNLKMFDKSADAGKPIPQKKQVTEEELDSLLDELYEDESSASEAVPEGKPIQQKKQVTEKELDSLLDELDEFFEDEPPASEAASAKPQETISPMPLPAAASPQAAEMQKRFRQEAPQQIPSNTSRNQPYLQDSFMRGLEKASGASKVESRKPGEFTPAILDFLFSSGEMRNVSWGLRNEAAQVNVGDTFRGDSLNLIPDAKCLKKWSAGSDTLKNAPLDNVYTMLAYQKGDSNRLSPEVKKELISKWIKGVDEFIEKQLKEGAGIPQMTLVQYHQKNMPVHDQDKYGQGLGKSTSLRKDKGDDLSIQRDVKAIIPPPPNAARMGEEELITYYRSKLLDALDLARQQKPRFN